jgi:hypothetical protein|tara:strand:+ start:71 stop:334 length:264 start_codon:yes stop_codon:yes gene_type:complete
MAGAGGKRKGAGRKPKSDEDRIRGLSISALSSVYGSEDGAMNHLAEQSQVGGKDGFPYLKLLLEYAYGKPKETIDLTNNIVTISFED